MNSGLTQKEGVLMGNSTIKDIARHANVSVATVSRVINRQDNVSKKAKERVLLAIKELDYHPNRAARDLKRQSSKTIAFLIADTTNEYYGQIAQAIISILEKEGYTLLICNSFNDSEIEKNYLTMLYERSVDGIILNSCGHNDAFITQMSHKIPIILIHRRISYPGFSGDFIDVDFGNATYEMTLGLLRNNHRKIALLCGPLFLSSANERFQHFKRAMDTVHITVEESYPYFRTGSHSWEFGYEAAKQLLSLPDPPTAIVAGHNEICIGLLRYCKDTHLEVPESLSIVSPCNVNLADLFYATPTCALPDTRALGCRIGQMLLERIGANNDTNNGAGSREVMFIPRIIEGNSVKTLT